MLVNIDFVNKKREERLQKIKTLRNSKSFDVCTAALWVDQNAPVTCNKKMLNDAGYNVETVTNDNVDNVIEALSQIGITVIDFDHLNKTTLAKTLNDIIYEPIPECWGGIDVREYISLKETKNV
jgi:hypothetical protein